MIVAVPAAVFAIIGAFRGHWLIAAFLIVIAVAEAYADGRGSYSR